MNRGSNQIIATPSCWKDLSDKYLVQLDDAAGRHPNDKIEPVVLKRADSSPPSLLSERSVGTLTGMSIVVSKPSANDNESHLSELTQASVGDLFQMPQQERKILGTTIVLSCAEPTSALYDDKTTSGWSTDDPLLPTMQVWNLDEEYE